MTGAVMPGGADAVVMQEQIAREQDKISLRGNVVQKGLNVRYAGEDMRRGETILDRGTRLGPAEIGLLASTGFNEVAVTRKLRIAFFSTGDELSSIGMPLSHGRIYDSNRYTLSCMLSEPGIECYDLGIVRDQREAVRGALTQASEVADLILTSGGVSVGEADFVTETLRELGEINFWRMAIKPGKPLAFGRLNNAWFFGLPGNPVSTMVTFYQFVLPAIRKMAGAQMREPFLIQARCAGNLNKQAGRMEFQRGILKREADGGWIVSTTGLQDSHVLSSMSKANCFVLLAAESTGANDGDLVTVQPFIDFCV
jgi:molybdopterin molybdotransferase